MKLLVPILAGIIVLGGATIGLGYAGIINIPGITPSKKATPAVEKAEAGVEASADADSSPTASAAESPEEGPSSNAAPPEEEASLPPPPAEEAPRKDGTERLAKLWATMDAQKVAALVQQWNDGDVLLVLAKMDDEKLAEVLSALPPERALELSRGIKALDRGGK